MNQLELLSVMYRVSNDKKDNFAQYSNSDSFLGSKIGHPYIYRKSSDRLTLGYRAGLKSGPKVWGFCV